MILAIIPARGGSVRLPRKNLRLLGGESLLVRAINQARQSKYIDRIAVSTDDDEIALAAKQERVAVIRRPAELAQGEPGSMLNTIRYTLQSLAYQPDIVVILQVTCPLRYVRDIDDTIALIWQKKVDSAMSVSPRERAHIWEEYWSPEWGNPENGAVYASKYHVFMELNQIVNTKSLALYHMPPERSLDIDTLEDLEKAERMLK